MGKVNILWSRFYSVEAELEQMQPGDAAYEQKRYELLDIYNQIQEAEADLSTWKTSEVAA